MKIAHSQPFSRRSFVCVSEKGYTLIETVIALTIGALLVIVMLNLVGMFYGGTAILQGSLIDTRVRIDEVGLTIKRTAASTRRSFVFSGKLNNPDGSRYLGGPLTLSQPLHAIADATAFLTAAGLTLVPAGTADEHTIVAIGDPLTPLWIYRESHLLPDGTTSVSIAMATPSLTRRASFVATGSNTGDQLAAAKGSASIAADSHAVLVLPNPLAIASARFPATLGGLRVDFPAHSSRALP